MFRKSLHIVLCLLVLISFSTPVFANELETKVIKLQPSDIPQIVLDR